VIPRVEFSSMCNARPIADRFHVDAIYQRIDLFDPSYFLNFRPEFPRGATDGLRNVPSHPISTSSGVPVFAGDDGRRPLEFLLPELRLLQCPWAFDHDTRTLFTSDVFSWVWRDADDGPWLLADGDDDPTTLERVSEFLLHNRYWWLAGSDTSRIRAWLADVFDRYPVERVAPDHGCVLTGAAIARHRGLLDDALADAATRPASGVAVGRWTTSGVR
jgi:hypothetical protein